MQWLIKGVRLHQSQRKEIHRIGVKKNKNNDILNLSCQILKKENQNDQNPQNISFN